MKIKVYNLTGKENGTIDLKEEVFGVKVKPEVVHEVFTALASNQREPWAHTKGRGDVRGGGKKPWKQKGTGRARQGSIRSPLWTGGGVTFGPLSERNYKLKINSKVRRAALKMCLSDRVANTALFVLEDYNFADNKTKLFADLMKKLPVKQKSFLVLTPSKDVKVMRITSNLQKVDTMRAADLNVYDLLNHQAIIADKAAVAKLEETLSK